mgnify:FL=1
MAVPLGSIDAEGPAHWSHSMEYEESVELVTEQTMEAASLGHAASAPWHRMVAVSSLFLALMAATAALFAGITAHEILLERTEEVIDITFLEGERLSIEVIEAKHDVLAAIGVEPDPGEVARVEDYRRDVERLEAAADEADAAVVVSSSTHLRFAISATVIAVGIAVTGLSLLTRRWVWVAGTVVGAVGVALLVTAVVDFVAA